MKLKTKFQDEDFELGEVVDATFMSDYGGKIGVYCTEKTKNREYSSIKDFTDHWEDAPEEPKKGWYLDSIGRPIRIVFGDDDFRQTLEAIGNYFESEEETRKAVEKLRAFTRLKDKGFRFNGIEVFSEGLLKIDGVLSALKGTDSAERLKMIDDLNTCFGGEE